jgi:acetyl esterase/lipase
MATFVIASTVIAADTPPQEVVYKKAGDTELKMFLDYPPDWKPSDSRPVMVFFFGGGWNAGSIDQFAVQADYFASRGLVTARADYRVKSRDGVTPDACVADARSAVRWIRTNARKLGVDPDKLIVSGGSAGGHLAACMIIEDSVETPGDDLSVSTMPQAMVLFNPVLSFENDLLISRLGDKQNLAKKISPTAYLNKKTPPALILFGTEDKLKVFGDAYWKKADELGLRADKYLAEGQGHGFFNRSPWQEKTILAADKFLVSLGYLKGEPTVEVPDQVADTTPQQRPRSGHPDTTDWPSLFNADLSNAIKDDGVWTVADGVLTATEDKAIWTDRDYENFVLDLEFKTAEGTNSGVVVYCTDIDNWIPNSVEIQIADDFADEWAKSPDTWHCGAIFGHLAPTKSMVKEPGQWNRFTIRCVGQKIDVMLNGQRVTSMDMSLWTSATKNPDGSEIPAWLNRPYSALATKGKIGLQGKHAGAPVWFRNIKIKQLPSAADSKPNTSSGNRREF